ncbi:ThuA domain-containing protein [Kitasatospora terrestris]|uniref:ThuA domain-containing protein n=1 Tax=Kitasatospora terrestris TaxID=258051 RepID=A0ABP9DHP6_9ACTN
MKRARGRWRGAVLAAALGLAGLPAITAPQAAADGQPFKVLVFTKTASGAPRHDSIAAGVQAIKQLGVDNGFDVVQSEDSSVFNTATLNGYNAVVMLQTSGMVWDTDAQRQAVQEYVRSGHGVVAVHNATDMKVESTFPWWDETVMAGAHMTTAAASQQATVKVLDKVHPSTKGLPDRWTRTDEWYNFDKDTTGSVHVLATVDETTYNAGAAKMQVLKTGADGYQVQQNHPISWCRGTDGLKVWATAMGHDAASYSDVLFKQHLLGGIKWAAGAAAGDCGATVASRFQKVTLQLQPDQPMQLDVAPGGKVFYITRPGKVHVIHTDEGAPETHDAAALNVYSGGEDGGLGLALDPNYATNRWMYITYAPKATSTVQVSRFTVKADDTLDMSSEKKIIEWPDDRTNDPAHAGGNLAFGPGGNLYIGTGDDTNPFSSNYAPIDETSGRAGWDAQRTSANTNDLRGKILRIHPEAAGNYTVPAGNLFAPGAAKTKPEIYAMGVRNAFRFSVDQKTGNLAVADYGPDAKIADPNRGPVGQVEWNLMTGPGNYGWPYCSGNNIPFNDYDFATKTSGPKFDCSAPVNNSPNNTGLTDLPPAKAPQVSYDYNPPTAFPELEWKSGNGAAPMAGPFYHYDAASTSERKFPEYYDGTSFFYEWDRGFVKEMRTDASGGLLKINPFAAKLDAHSPMDMKFGPDGAMYLIEWGHGYGTNPDAGIYRIDYVPGNRSPQVKTAASPDSGQAPLNVSFSSAGTVDPDNDTLTYRWDFGDGATATTADPSHVYTVNGNYNATLTVTDSGGKTAALSVPVTVGNTRPTLTFTEPALGSFAAVGDYVNYTLTGSDPEDGALDCSKVLVIAALGHDTHTHDGGSTHGCSGTIRMPLEGHGSEVDTFLQLSATYTDTGGLDVHAGVRLAEKERQAEYYEAQSGLKKISRDTAQAGFALGDVGSNEWFSFKPMNTAGMDTVSFRVAAPADGHGTIELHADSPTGPLMAASPVAPGKDWYTYTWAPPVRITDPGGTHPVYVVFKNPRFDIDSVAFAGAGLAVPNSPQASHTYTLTSAVSGKVMDVKGAFLDDGVPVLQYNPTGKPNQQWKLADGGNGTFTLTSVLSGKCLEVPVGAVDQAGAGLVQSTCTGAANQKWTFEPVGKETYRLVSAAGSNRCVDVPSGTTDVRQLVQWTCGSGTPATKQQWTLSKLA